MGGVRTGLVKYRGVSKKFPKNPEFFTEENFSQTLTLPCEKLDIGSLLSVHADVDILSLKFVKTPKGLSNEGQNLSGCKAVIEIKIKQKIRYVADVKTQPIHASHFENIIGSLFIIIPCEIDGKCMKDLFDKKRIVITPYIEDIFAKAIDQRNIYTDIALFLNLKIGQM